MSTSPEVGWWIWVALAVIILGCGVGVFAVARARRFTRATSGSPNQQAKVSVIGNHVPSEKLLASELDVPIEASLVTDAHRHIIWCNPEFTTLTGYGITELMGRNCGLLQGPETDAQTVEDIRRTLDARLTYRGRVLNYRRDGSKFWNHLTINPLHDINGAVVNFVSVQSDITEQVGRELAFIERLPKHEPKRD